MADMLLGGCSEDEFTDVRTWIVAQGRDFHPDCLTDPPLLANERLNNLSDVMDAEEIRHVPDEIFMEMTGTSIDEQYPARLSASMAGQEPAYMSCDE